MGTPVLRPDCSLLVQCTAAVEQRVVFLMYDVSEIYNSRANRLDIRNGGLPNVKTV